MEKSYTTSKQQNTTTTICERLKRAIQTTSPIKPIHFTSNNQIHQEPSSLTPSRTIPLMTRTLTQDRCPRPRPVDKITQSDPNVPIIFRQSEINSKSSRDSPNFSPMRNNNRNSPKKYSKPIAKINNSEAGCLPIHGIEHRIPPMSNVEEKSTITESINGLFTKYIDREGRKIRSPTIVAGMKIDSFNDKVSEFINRAKHKFHNTPSSVESPFNEKGVK